MTMHQKLVMYMFVHIVALFFPLVLHTNALGRPKPNFYEPSCFKHVQNTPIDVTNGLFYVLINVTYEYLSLYDDVKENLQFFNKWMQNPEFSLEGHEQQCKSIGLSRCPNKKKAFSKPVYSVVDGFVAGSMFITYDLPSLLVRLQIEPKTYSISEFVESVFTEIYTHAWIPLFPYNFSLTYDGSEICANGMHGHAFIRFNTELCTTFGTWCDVNLEGASPEKQDHALTRIKNALLKRKMNDLSVAKYIKEYDLGLEIIPSKSKELRDTITQIEQEMSEIRLKIDDKFDFDYDQSDEDYSDEDNFDEDYSDDNLDEKQSAENVPIIDFSDFFFKNTKVLSVTNKPIVEPIVSQKVHDIQNANTFVSQKFYDIQTSTNKPKNKISPTVKKNTVVNQTSHKIQNALNKPKLNVSLPVKNDNIVNQQFQNMQDAINKHKMGIKHNKQTVAEVSTYGLQNCYCLTCNLSTTIGKVHNNRCYFINLDSSFKISSNTHFSPFREYTLLIINERNHALRAMLSQIVKQVSNEVILAKKASSYRLTVFSTKDGTTVDKICMSLFRNTYQIENCTESTNAVLIARNGHFIRVPQIQLANFTYCDIGAVKAENGKCFRINANCSHSSIASVYDLDNTVVSYLVSITQNTAHNMSEAKFQIKNIDDSSVTSEHFIVYNKRTNSGQECTYVDMRSKTISIEKCKHSPTICEVLLGKSTLNDEPGLRKLTFWETVAVCVGGFIVLVIAAICFIIVLHSIARHNDTVVNS